MKEEKFGIGKRFITNEGYEIEIVEKLEHPYRKIKFNNGHEMKSQMTHIIKGAISNPFHPSICNVGYIGNGRFKSMVNKKTTQEYEVWRNMLQRCYDEKTQERQPGYKMVKVCKDWHNFQNFAKFYEDNYPKINNLKLSLDKDLLQQGTENKIYSPETCVFLPQYVNNFLTNKKSNNTSGYTGVSWYSDSKKWVVHIHLLEKNKQKTLGYFQTPELASQSYQQARAEQSEKVKDYLRSLNYLPEETIQLVK